MFSNLTYCTVIYSRMFAESHTITILSEDYPMFLELVNDFAGPLQYQPIIYDAISSVRHYMVYVHVDKR